MTKKGEPTGVHRDNRDVEGSKRETTGRGTRWQKQARGAGLQGPTGTWGVGQGRQDSNCRMGGGVWWDGSLFGKAAQDRNEGGKLNAKRGAAQSQGSGW